MTIAQILSKIHQDGNLFSHPDYPLVTIYDDNLFIRNDYDILSPGQRRYLIEFFSGLGFKQLSGKRLVNGNLSLSFPTPVANLAVSGFQDEFLQPSPCHLYCVTPTQFAQTLFYDIQRIGEAEALARIKSLIEHCPYNIEWLRDISYHSDIEQVTINSYPELMAHQKAVIERKFKRKRAF